MTRRLARDIVFKIIYQADIQKESFETIFSIVSMEKKFDESSENYITDTLRGIELNTEKIDEIISKKSEGWTINRISKISLACLKLGIYEILYSNDVPDTVAINEAVNITKTYEGEESAKFVNGILSVVLKEK